MNRLPSATEWSLHGKKQQGDMHSEHAGAQHTATEGP